MEKTIINLNAEEINLASVVKTKNCFRIGEWFLRYNESKNSVKFAFEDVKPRALRVSISESTGWVRFMRTLDIISKPGIYDVLLTLRALTVNQKSKYQPYIFVCYKPGNFEKHTKLEACEGGYKTKLNMQNGGPQYWIGFETLDEDIQLNIDHIRLVLAESSDELSTSTDPHKIVALPLVGSEPRCATYSNIEKWNNEYESRINSDELSFLLEYSEGVRRVEMPETFIGMVRYLVAKYQELNAEQRKILEHQVKCALLISHDEMLVDLIYRHCPALLVSLDMNEEILCKLAGFEIEAISLEHNSLNKHAYFALQNQPEKLFTLIHRELLKNKNYLNSNPSGYCALANSYVSSTVNSSRYLACINEYFEHYRLPHLEAIDLGSEQSMSGMRFNDSSLKQTKGPLVSIMMSAYQAEKTIGYAIESLLKQTYQNIEILVCDDCSKDKTLQVALEWAAKDEKVRVFKSNGNQGTYNIRNDLIEKSKGEYLTFHDSDDFAFPCRIAEQMNVLVNEHKTVCFSEWLRLKNDGSIVYFHDGNVSRFCVVSAMAHRSVFDRVPPFRSALVAADTEFFELCKYLLGSEEIVIVRKPLILGLWGDGSLTKRENLSADHSGFVAPRRRMYAEIAARQRLLGDVLISDNDVIEVLKKLDIYCNPKGVVAVSIDGSNGAVRHRISEKHESEALENICTLSNEQKNVAVNGVLKTRIA